MLKPTALECTSVDVKLQPAMIHRKTAIPVLMARTSGTMRRRLQNFARPSGGRRTPSDSTKRGIRVSSLRRSERDLGGAVEHSPRRVEPIRGTGRTAQHPQPALGPQPLPLPGGGGGGHPPAILGRDQHVHGRLEPAPPPRGAQEQVPPEEAGPVERREAPG